MNFAMSAMDHLAAENIGVIKAKLFQSNWQTGVDIKCNSVIFTEWRVFCTHKIGFISLIYVVETWVMHADSGLIPIITRQYAAP
jgi:hypothetical protein